MILVRVTKSLPAELFHTAARILSLHVPIIPVHVYAFKPEEKEIVTEWLKQDAFPEVIDDDFLAFFQSSDDTFSWGKGDKEFIFLQISENEEFLLDKPPKWTESYAQVESPDDASYLDRVHPETVHTSRYRRDESDDWPLLGLMAHEYLHSLQRQWGLEDDINGALAFTSSFFDSLIKEFGESLPEDKYGPLRESLVQVSQVALYALKELYCNWELRRFGLHEHLLQYLIKLFGDSMRIPCATPSFGVKFTLGKQQEDLISVTEAMSLALATIPNWISFIGFDKRATRLRKIIAKCYIGSIPTIANELEQLFPLYLSMFEFSKRFSVSYFTYIFVFFFDFVQGQSLAFTHVASVIESLQILEQRLGDYDLSWIFEPILKLAHLIALSSKWGRIPEAYREYLESLMEDRFSRDVYQEWLEHSSEFDVIDLILLPLFGIFQIIRRLLLSGNQLEARIAIYVWQQLYEVRKHIKNNQKIEIFEKINDYLTNLLTTGFPSRRIYLPRFMFLETSIKNLLFDDHEFYATPDEAMHLVHLLTHFRVPLHNKIIDAAMKMLDDVKYIFGTEDLINANSIPLEISEVLSIVILGNEHLKKSNHQHLLTILLQCVLLTLNVSFQEIRKIKKVFENIQTIDVTSNSEDSENEEKERS